MTPDELYQQLTKDIHSFSTRLPDKYEVDADTYAQCCQSVFNNQVENGNISTNLDFSLTFIRVILGKNNGLMFKGVELILEKKDAKT